MPHKLLITFKIKQRKNEDLAEFLGENEVTRGELADLTLEIKNLGDKVFPGGVLGLITIRYTQTLTSIKSEILSTKLPKIPSLDSKEKPFTTPIISVIPLEDGLASVEIRIRADDGQPIEYYQTEKTSPLGTEKWYNFFHVASSENILILQELKTIKILLERL